MNSSRGSESFPSVCLLSGTDGVCVEEWKSAWIKHYCTSEGKSVDYESFDATSASPEKIRDALQSMPMMQPYRVVVIQHLEKCRKELETNLESLQEQVPSSAALLLVIDKPDQRKRWVKAFNTSQRHIQFPLPKRQEWNDWITSRATKMGFKMTSQAAQFLAEWIGEDPWRLVQEIQKVGLYVGGEATIQLRDVENVVSGLPLSDIFISVDALFEGREEEALAGFRKLLNREEPPLRLLSMILRHLRQLFALRILMGQGKRDPQTLARELGLHPYFIRRYIDQAQAWKTPELLQVFKILRRCDEELKGESRLPVEITLEKTLLDVLEVQHVSENTGASPQHYR